MKLPDVSVKLPAVTLLDRVTLVPVFATSRFVAMFPAPLRFAAVPPTSRRLPVPAIVPLTVALAETARLNPLAIVSVAPAFTVRESQAAVATPLVDGLFGVPDGMTALVPELGTPPVQLPARLQTELTDPFHVLWAESTGDRTRKTKIAVARVEGIRVSCMRGVLSAVRPASGCENRRAETIKPGLAEWGQASAETPDAC